MIERRVDETIGIHVRRLAFAELLPSHAHLVKPSLFYRASGWRRLTIRCWTPGCRLG